MDLLKALSVKVASSLRLGGSNDSFVQPDHWTYPNGWLWGSSLNSDQEETLERDFISGVRNIYKSNGVVFACSVARQTAMSDISFGWRRRQDGRWRAVHSNVGLKVLESPRTNLSALLSRSEADVTAAGNSYATFVDDDGNYGSNASGPTRRLARLRPDWVTIIIGSRSGDPRAIDARKVGYVYHPYGTADDRSVTLLDSEVIHYAPIPDPEFRFRGMSWITPIIREIQSDQAATKHKKQFFENGAIVGQAIKFDPTVSEANMRKYIDLFEAEHRGSDNAYNTWYLGGGADPIPLGSNLQQLDLKNIQGYGETRIAMAAGVHPILIGAAESMQGATFGTGNYPNAKRDFIDGTVRGMWSSWAAAAAAVFPAPSMSDSLSYDDRDVAFLRQDQQDEAKNRATDAQTMRTFIDAGFEPDSVKDYMITGDVSKLTHSGLASVQLTPIQGSEPGVAQDNTSGNDSNSSNSSNV